MAEQMLKLVGSPSIKQSDEFIDLKKLNNQPLDPKMETNPLNSYLHFSPLGEGEDKTMSSTPTVKFPGNGTLSSDDDRFQIQNMSENDSDDSMNEEGGISHDPPSDHENIHVHEHAYVKTPPHASRPEDVINEEAQNEEEEAEMEVEQDDPENTSEAQEDSIHKEENSENIGTKTDEEKLLEEEPIDESEGQEISIHKEENSENVETKTDEEKLLEEELKDESEEGITQNDEKIGQSTKLDEDSQQTENSLDNEKSEKSETISHEMECQTEEMSDDHDDIDSDDAAESTVKEEKNSDIVMTPEPPEEKIVVEKLKDTGNGSDDETLTMICESITKETFSKDNEGHHSHVDTNHDDDEDYDPEEYHELPIKIKKKKKKMVAITVTPKAGSVIPWKEAYGSTRDLDGEPDALKKPFEQGWRRELVIRGVYDEYSKAGQPKRQPADVYYFTPDNRKLRSKIMISNYLTERGSTLTQENFSFIRRPIHKPPEEMVRQAGKSKGRKSLPTPGKPISPFKSSPGMTPSTSPRQHGKKRKRTAGRPRKFSLSDSINQLEDSHKGSPSVPPPEVVLEREGQEEPYEKKKTLPNELIVYPGTGVKQRIFPTPKKSKPTARKSTTQVAKRNNLPPRPEIISPNFHRLNSGQLCGLDCPGRGGKTPSLTCGVCMCLFHPECVNTPLTQLQNFMCLRCKSSSFPAHSTMSNGTSAQSLLSQSTPMLRSCLSSVSTGPQTILTTSGSGSMNNMKILIPVPPPSGLQMANASQTNNSIGPVAFPISMSGSQIAFIPQTTPGFNTTVSPSVMSSIPFTGMPVAPPKLTLAPTSRPPSGASSEQTQIINNKDVVSTSNLFSIKNSIINVTNATLVSKAGTDSSKDGGGSVVNSPQTGRSTPAQLLTLPAAVSKRLNLMQPLALKINNKQILAPPSCFLRTGDTIKVCLPPNTVPVSGGQLSFDMQVKVNGESVSNSISVLSIDGANSMNGISESCQKDNKTAKKDSKMAKNICHFHKLWSGFEAMLEIFSHLKPKDLLRARCVCKTWKRLASQTSLWQHVSLRGVHVKQWQKAVKLLKNFGTESLDFQGYAEALLEPDLFPALGELPLSRLDLGEVSPWFLHSVGKHLPSLVHLTAKVKGTEDCFVDFGQLSHLTELRELRLHPSDWHGVGDTKTKGQKLADMVTLTQLECLVLTGIKDIDENDWRFLGETTKLRQLEVSSCSSWNSSTYFLLGQCTELEILRLSNGSFLPDVGLADSLVNLTKLKHLSLEKWAIPHSLQDVLSELEELETLSLSPDSNAQSAVINRNTLSAVWDLSQLKSLRWGINNSQDSTIILNDGDGAEQHKSGPTQSQTKQCIPFLSDDVESDDVTDLDLQQMTQFISIDQLREKLQSLLPSSHIDVYVLSNHPSEPYKVTSLLKESQTNSSTETPAECADTSKS